jgi:hypothetical protein
MADYTFGENILRYIQGLDELKMRRQQMNVESARFNANFQQRQRQIDLENLRYQAAAQKENVVEQQKFLTNFTKPSDVPTDVAAKIDPSKYLTGTTLRNMGWNVPQGSEDVKFVPKSYEGDIEQQLGREQKLQSEADLQKNRETQLKISQGNLDVARGRLAVEQQREQREKANATPKGMLSVKDKSALMGDISAQIAQYDLNKGFSGTVMDAKGNEVKGDVLNQMRNDWKKNVIGNVDNLLSGVGLGTTKNSKALAQINSYVTPATVKDYATNDPMVKKYIEQYQTQNGEAPDQTKIEAMAKRVILYDAIGLYADQQGKVNKPLNEDQINALKLWAEGITR